MGAHAGYGPDRAKGYGMRRTVSRVALAVILAFTALPSVARADDPAFVGWSDLLPGLTAGYDPSSENLCKKGHESCVHAVIKEMYRRFDPLCERCDHDAVFALTYLRTTEEYHRFWHEGHFDEPNWLNHYDAVFGEYYFRAYDDWHGGTPSQVPEAWRIAFDAADRRQVSGTGNLFLGMSAHINRDLPYVLASIGMTAPDGSSRKPDHDTVNQFLNRVSDTLLPELARRFDATIDDSEVAGTTADNLLTFQVVPAWREKAWRNAELLVSAKTSLERSLVTASIEADAALVARAIVDATAYGPLSASTADARDAYCAVHHWDA